MRLIIEEKNKTRINRAIEWLLYIVGYIIVFIFVTSFFTSIYIDKDNPIIYSIAVVLIIYILNQTLKPILVSLTIPITGLTLGLFYPFINVFILKIADILLGSHFKLNNIYIAVVFAILLSIMNLIMESIINRIVKRVRKYE